MWGNLHFVGKHAIFVGEKKLIMARQQVAVSLSLAAVPRVLCAAWDGVPLACGCRSELATESLWRADD